MTTDSAVSSVDNQPLNFSQVLEAEQREVGCRPPGKSVGLAFSGGGIRSATFNLGVLQALAERRMLGKFDYLSTISGGGYIGSWLTTFIRRLAEGDVARAEELLQLKDKGLEHPAIRFLRSFSNYLTPRLGITGDALTAVATYLRNLILNLSVLATLVVVLLLMPRISVAFGISISQESSWRAVFSILVFFILLPCIRLIALNLFYRPKDDPTDDKVPWFARGDSRLFLMEVPVMLAAWLGTYCYIVITQNDASILKWMASTVAVYLMLWVVGLPSGVRYQSKNAAAFITSTKHNVQLVFGRGARWFTGFVLSATIVGALGGLLFYAVVSLFSVIPPVHRPWVATVLGPPAVVGCFLLMIVAHIGLIGRGFSEQDRELWSRFGGRFLGILLGWIVLFGIALYGPAAVVWAENWVLGLGGFGWIASTLFGVLAGRSTATGEGKSKAWLEALTRIAPYVFALGLLLAFSYAIHVALNKVDVSWLHGNTATCAPAVAFGTDPTPGVYLHAQPRPGNAVVTVKSVDDPSKWTKFLTGAAHESCIMSVWLDRGWILFLATSLLAIVAWLLSLRININLFSLHHFYHNRLARCYLGATNPNRRYHPVTGFDPYDDIELTKVQQKPLHILGTAINLNRGRQLAWQNRRAASFAFTPLHVGYEPASRHVLGGYRSTADYGRSKEGRSIHLGTVVAISGAAASPNQGFHTSPAVAFLLTLFNVRLGRWCGDTQERCTAWRMQDPVNSLRYWWAEMSGTADQDYPFVSLSDGGHFENLGIYELVRRRCAVIVASDAGADKNYVFDDLADAIRKCYTDFGVRIDINVDDIRPQEATKVSASHYAVGSIEYADGSTGRLIYWKSSLINGMPPDIQNYKLANADFPHQTTADQWFDESQFESYRKLGYLVAKESIKDMVKTGVLPSALR